MAEVIISALLWVPAFGFMCWACYKAGYSKGRQLGMKEVIESQ